jgi:tRNA-intron endonuclease
MLTAVLCKDHAQVVSSSAVFDLVKEQIGTHAKTVTLNMYEIAYLLGCNKLKLVSSNGSLVSYPSFMKQAQKQLADFLHKARVYAHLRSKGYVVKAGLKFGGDFRVYEKGSEHSAWVVVVMSNHAKTNLHDVSAKCRVAHSTKKSVVFALVDEDMDVTYYEFTWKAL